MALPAPGRRDMRKFWIWLSMVLLPVMMLVPARAEDPAPVPEAWQAAITAQIVAFRQHDAEAAFVYAAAPFHEGALTAEQFFDAIVGSGYAPIMTSKSHSFGPYKVLDDGSVGQVVHFVDADQKLYDAVYALSLEGSEWRVDGVQMMKVEGMGV